MESSSGLPGGRRRTPSTDQSRPGSGSTEPIPSFQRAARRKEGSGPKAARRHGRGQIPQDPLAAPDLSPETVAKPRHTDLGLCLPHGEVARQTLGAVHGLGPRTAAFQADFPCPSAVSPAQEPPPVDTPLVHPAIEASPVAVVQERVQGPAGLTAATTEEPLHFWRRPVSRYPPGCDWWLTS